MSWKSESEARLARAVAQAEVEGMNIDSVRAQAAATLALVEVTERLAVAQETANLIANVAMVVSSGSAERLSPDAAQGITTQANEVSIRISRYLS